jgi:hypothetical protein
LLRKLCACHGDQEVTQEYAERLAAAGWIHPPNRVAWPKGCSDCDSTGYKGRLGIYELLSIDDSIRSILRGVYKPDLVRTAARNAGMRFMQEDALQKLQAGVTTLEEILRVVPMEAVTGSGCEQCGHDLSPTYRFCPYCGMRRGAEFSGSSGVKSLNVPEGVLS